MLKIILIAQSRNSVLYKRLIYNKLRFCVVYRVLPGIIILKKSYGCLLTKEDGRKSK